MRLTALTDWDFVDYIQKFIILANYIRANTLEGDNLSEWKKLQEKLGD